MMHDFVELGRDERIYICDACVYRALDVLGDAQRPLHHLFDQRRDLAARLFALLIVAPDSGFRDDLIEQAAFRLSCLNSRGCLRLRLLLGHYESPWGFLLPAAAGCDSLLIRSASSVLLIISCSFSPNLLLPSALASNPLNCFLTSINLRNGSTWPATCSGSKSSIPLRRNSTPILVSSLVSLLSTWNASLGFIPFITSLKLSRSISMNLRSRSRGSASS